MSIEYTPSNTFIFCFVRMNPPTPGHIELIKTLINKAIELKTEKIYIINIVNPGFLFYFSISPEILF